jgi:hypothetical protein
MVKDFLIATFAEEQRLLEAVRQVRAQGFKIYDVYAPYPVHGLSEAMGLRRSRLPLVTLAAGLLGLASALFLQFYIAVIDWNVNVGGKPDNSTLAFLPITFEITVLMAGLSTAAAFFLRARLFPGARAVLLEEGVTDDVFAIVLRRRDTTFDAGKARRLLEQSGADWVRQQAVEG